QDVAAEAQHLVDFRPAGDNELSDTDSLVRQESVCQLSGGAQQRSPYRAVMRHQTRPQSSVQPVFVARYPRTLSIHARVVFESDRALRPIGGKKRLDCSDRLFS